MNKISIALCTYNGARFLEEQLLSFLRQARLPDELVVCDDCSNDETAEIIERFAQTSPFPVRLYQNETNLGSTKNFERAISLCAGDLIFLSDQDDIWLPEKLARIEIEFDKQPRVGMVFSDAQIVDENLQATGENLWSFTFSDRQRDAARNGNLLDVLVSQNVVTGATMAFRAAYRSSFMPIPDDIPHLIHDGWIALLISAQAEIALVDEPLIKYRQHAGQQIGINYETRQRRAQNFKERRAQYAASIALAEDEIERLKKMREIFSVYPQFETRRKTAKFENLIEEQRQKIKHYERRRNLPSSRRKRLPPVIREILSRRYHKFSKGFSSAAKDIFETW